MVTVREYEQRDANDWRAMRRELFEGEPEHLLAGEEDQIETTGRLKGQRFLRLIALDEGRPIGFAEATIRSSAEGCLSGPVAYVEAWFVRRDHRRASVGRALIDAVETWARAQGCEELASDTRAGDVSAESAHRSVGFEDVGAIRCFRKPLDE